MNKMGKRFDLLYNWDLPFFSGTSLLVVWILLKFVDWTDLSEVVEPLDSLSELVDSIDLSLDVSFDINLWYFN